MNILSVREVPEQKAKFISYFQKRWASERTMMVYEDCIDNCLSTKMPLPQWYLLMDGDEIIGCAGLITNDFISRMDLWPWLCALYIEKEHRGNRYGQLLLEAAKKEALQFGFDAMYLCTDHVGYYEKYDFEYIGQGYHPWGESSRIYKCQL